MKKLAIGISAIAMAVSGAAFAAQHEGRHGPDADNNGIVTRAESQAHAVAVFARMDANEDGKLDAVDRSARKEQRRTKMFAALDSDKNGQISRDEFMSFERTGKHARQGSHGKAHHMKHARGHHGMMVMAQADTDNDNAVSEAEFTASTARHFDKMDTDGNGEITREERQAARKAMYEDRRQKMRDRSES